MAGAGTDATEDVKAALRAQIEALQAKNVALHFKLVAAQRDQNGGASISGFSGAFMRARTPAHAVHPTNSRAHGRL